MNRSQRCGQCRGCTSKPCGQCVYCQDSPQFGGPGVKKQSCIERRCLRVLENKLQRDGPQFKAKAGCGKCEECLTPDCQTCLVCLDRRFFENRYLPGAICGKKRCNQSKPIELPVFSSASPANGQTSHSSTSANSSSSDYPRPLNGLAPRPVMDGLFAPVFHRPMQQELSGALGPLPCAPLASQQSSPMNAMNGAKRKGSDSAQKATPRKKKPGKQPLNGGPLGVGDAQPGSVAITHHPLNGPPPSPQPPLAPVLQTPHNQYTTGLPVSFNTAALAGSTGDGPLVFQQAFHQHQPVSNGPTVLNGQLPSQFYTTAVSSTVQALANSQPAQHTTNNGPTSVTAISTATVIPVINGTGGLSEQAFLNSQHLSATNNNNSLLMNGHALANGLLMDKMPVNQDAVLNGHPPAASVTHLSPAHFTPCDFYPPSVDRIWKEDPATMIPPSFSGKHTVVLQPL